jgi:hypothetical protein
VTYATLETLLVFKKRSEAHGTLEKRLHFLLRAEENEIKDYSAELNLT